MVSIVLVDFKGLVTSPGLYARAAASAVRLWNFRISSPGVLRKRTAQQRQANVFGAPTWQILANRLLDTILLEHCGVGAATSVRKGNGTMPPVNLPAIDAGNITRAIGTRMQEAALLQRNHYLTADEGLARVESGLANVRFAGMPRAWFDILGVTLLGAGTAVADLQTRAYRATWHRDDADGVEMGGPPTHRVRVANAPGTLGYVAATTANVTLRVALTKEWGTLATNITAGDNYYVKLWATRSAGAAGSLTEEYFLVDVRRVTGTEIGLGYAAMVDTVPDSLLIGQERLHTNSEAFPAAEAGAPIQGLANADEAPPRCNTVAEWQGRIWGGDITYRPRLQVELVAVSDAGGLPVTALQIGDTVTVGGITMTAAAAPGAFQFVKVNSNPEATARNFIEGFNAGTNEARAYTVSTAQQRPGLIYFEYARFQAAPVNLVLSNPTAWLPRQTTTELPQESIPNGLVHSKDGRGDAFPSWAFTQVGPRTARILRLVPHQDILLVFTDAGLFRVTGTTDTTFVVQPQDNTYVLLNRDLVAECDGAVYAWCREGILRVQGLQAEIISTPIEDTLREVVRTGTAAALARHGWAIGYRQAHEVQFWYPEADDANCLGCFAFLAYDTRQGVWSQGSAAGLQTSGPFIPGFGFRENRSCGAVRWSDDLLFTSNANAVGADSYLWREMLPWESGAYLGLLTSGTPWPSQGEVTWQWLTPNPLAAVTWQQLVLEFERGDFSWRPLPVGFDVDYEAEQGLGGIVTTPQAVVLESPTVRLEVPAAVRHKKALRVHVVSDDAEYAGLVLAGLTMGEASKFSRKVG